MKNYKSIYCALILFLITCAGWGSAQAVSQQTSQQSAGKGPEVRSIAGGMEVRSHGVLLSVVALRDDVLRVRLSPTDTLPEDASWAVLSQSRTASIVVKQEKVDGKATFETGRLRVEVIPETLRLRVTDRAGNVLQEDAVDGTRVFDGASFRIRKAMPEDEHYFGLGDKPGPLDRRNQAFTMWNTDAYSFQESTDPIYKSIPFFLTVRQGRALGVLLDNTWRTSFDFGKSARNAYSFGSEGGPADYYLLYGPLPKQVLEAYAWLTGPTPLPPLWVLGYQQSRYSYETEAQVREVAKTLRQHRFPADALCLDIDFQDRNRPFTVSAERFPTFTQMLNDLKRDKFEVVAIADPHIAHAPDEGYAAYDTGSAGDHFVKNSDGSVYVGKVWPGPSVFPDFTRSSTRDWWGTLFRPLVAEGVAGFWNDMNEPSVFKTPGGTMPLSTQHRIEEPGFRTRNASHSEIHNIYGLENSRATYEGLLRVAPDRRPFVLTRATFAGGQRYAATWTGDNSSTWNHLRLSTPMILNLGLSGFALTGADVGGFIGTPEPDLLTRWFELGAFQPIDRDHTEKGTAPQEPWVHGKAQEDIRRKYVEERYRLMPYLYTVAEEMSRTGLPITRPLFLEFPQVQVDGNPIDLAAGGEFLFGPDLLVAPSPFPDKLDAYAVAFPSTGWYDYWTGQQVHGTASTGPEFPPESVRVQPGLESLPVYVRPGAIVPMQPLVQSTQEVPSGPLTLRVYPGPECWGSLYQDDGSTMAYRRGEFLRVKFTCQVTSDAVRVSVSSREGSYPAWWKQLRVEVFGQSGNNRLVRVNGATVADPMFDPARNAVAIQVPDDGKGMELEIGTAR